MPHETPAQGFAKCPVIWPDSTVAIIGGGPSLKYMDWDFLRCRLVSKGIKSLAVNDSYKLIWPNVCYWGDFGWYQLHKDRIFQMYKGGCFTDVFECYGEPGVIVLERRPRDFTLEPSKLGWFDNSGITAIGLAVKLGAKRVLLLGFDMSMDDQGNGNWYRNEKDQPSQLRFNRHVRVADTFAHQLTKACPDIQVVNCNPKSSLEVFPKATLHEALKGI